MDDYLLSEREQWEALKRWLRENGPAILAGVAVAALGLAGYRWWQARENNAALSAGATYIQMENAFGQGNRTEAFILLGILERHVPILTLRGSGEAGVCEGVRRGRRARESCGRVAGRDAALS